MKSMLRHHAERHRTDRISWLRAAVLGANDGIVSTASLLIGVLAAGADRQSTLLTGLAGMAAGAMSMAAGEYVSVHSQADTEKADLARERAELDEDPVAERHELTAIYVARGLEPALAAKVAEQLIHHDALGAHARDELGISEAISARPLQAAWASAMSFTLGAALPMTVIVWGPTGQASLPWVAGASLAFLGVLGAVAAQTGGADPARGECRIAFWGAIAMGVTALVGAMASRLA
jgi:VIT1/CCC1 family predicted Fe2+/Mn2+ transporter